MAKHILSCSFGKDSIATALLALQHGEPLDELVYCEVMFSEEISGELPEHNRFIHETAIPYFEQRGIPTRVLRSEKTYLSCFYHVVTRGKTKGMLSGFPLSGRCTIQRDCKLPPIKAYQKALPPDTVQYIGIAADEPKRLARLKPGQISLLDKYHVAEPEARSMCAAEGLLSPLYDFTKRGGCWFCPNASISELRHLYRYHPELWQLKAQNEKVDVMFKAEDVAKLNRIYEQLGYAIPKVTTADRKKDPTRRQSGDSLLTRGKNPLDIDPRPSVRATIMALKKAARTAAQAQKKVQNIIAEEER